MVLCLLSIFDIKLKKFPHIKHSELKGLADLCQGLWCAKASRCKNNALSRNVKEREKR